MKKILILLSLILISTITLHAEESFDYFQYKGEHLGFYFDTDGIFDFGFSMSDALTLAMEDKEACELLMEFIRDVEYMVEKGKAFDEALEVPAVQLDGYFSVIYSVLTDIWNKYHAPGTEL